MSINCYSSVNEAIKGCFGDNTTIAKSSGTMRGGISSATPLSLSDGRTVICKTNSIGKSGFFDAEEEGLNAIARTGTVRTPGLYCKGTDRKAGISFLMMEYIEPGRDNKETWVRLGHGFAQMHLADASGFVAGGRYGFPHDNYIGATPQINSPKDSWIDFFRECRLLPQIKMASRTLETRDVKGAERILDRLDEYLYEPERPSLLHGDMWGGNHLVDKNGGPVLIDPAAYVGHHEADLAMTDMFWPMPGQFYGSYHEMIPEEPGFKDRREIYNLYHWLNHLNLFGSSHLPQVLRIIRYYS
ncbi:MAG: fructosamine kinase family protein [Lachnospiraceae bacterium]|nr:fructosamine kinase family protein [Lachnospiraceae bacterium]